MLVLRPRRSRSSHLSPPTAHAAARRQPLNACAFMLALVITTPLAQAQPAAPDEESESRRGPTRSLASGRTLRLFPAGDLFPVYVADPHRPTNTILVNFTTRISIDDTMNPRFGLSAGGRFGMLRIDPASQGGRSWQVSIDAGLDALFDSQHKQDTIGWDGNYGFVLTTAAEGPLAIKVGILHVSAHQGDEHAERTGRLRLDYTREELVLGVARRFGRGWRAYAETGVGYVERYVEQEPWRLQGGLERESSRRLWGNRFAWYWATDFSSMQERDWRLDTTLQGGIVSRSEGRTHRLGVQFHDGRPTIGEFFEVSESYFTVGFWVDF